MAIACRPQERLGLDDLGEEGHGIEGSILAFMANSMDGNGLKGLKGSSQGGHGYGGFVER